MIPELRQLSLGYIITNTKSLVYGTSNDYGNADLDMFNYFDNVNINHTAIKLTELIIKSLFGHYFPIN